MSLTFVTIFPEAKNVHLRKGLGKIPYVLHRDFGFDCRFVCFKNEPEYPSLQLDVPGLKMEFLPPNSLKSSLWASAQYLFRNAKKIDILNIYGQSRWVFFMGIVYKKLNPNGLLFVKLDMNIEYVHRLKQSPNFFRHKFLWTYYYQKIADLISAEYQQLAQAFIALYTVDAAKLIHLPNGVDERAINKFGITKKKLEAKENIILIVARIGAPEKNHQLILSAASQLNLKDWKIVFIGAIEAPFQKEIGVFFEQNPNLKKSVLFEAEISDYRALSEWYNRSKVFCLSSLREGFPVVLPEAMYWGNYIVSTDISSIAEILEEGKIGSLIGKPHSLVDILQNIIDDSSCIAEKAQNSTHKAEQEYIWTKIVARLGQKILDFKQL